MKRLAATSSLFLLLAACGMSEASNSVVLELSEFSIEASSSRLAAGPVALQLQNAGTLPHTIVISGLDGEVVGVSDVVESGGLTSFVADLAPGEYEFTCRIVAEFDGQLVDHYELGMSTTFEVANVGTP